MSYANKSVNDWLMMVDLTSTASPDFVTTLTHAVAVFETGGAIALCQRSSQCCKRKGRNSND